MSAVKKTYVQILQEYMTQRNEVPEFLLITCGDSKDPLFKYQIQTNGKLAIGTGRSKKEAKQEAARLLLAQLENKPVSETENDSSVYSPYDDNLKDNAVGALQIFCGELHMVPEYELILDVGPPHLKKFTIRCNVSSFSTEATAGSKKQAKHKCSALMLEKLKEMLNFAEGTVGSGPLGLKMKDMHNIFRNNFYPFSERLSSLKEKDRDSLRLIEDPFEELEQLVVELNSSLTTTVLPALNKNETVVCIQMTTKPNWAWLGVGHDEESAKKEAAYDGLKFIHIMSF